MARDTYLREHYKVLKQQVAEAIAESERQRAVIAAMQQALADFERDVVPVLDPPETQDAA